MTSHDRHEAWEELVSASLTGDLSREERTRLDDHLDRCDACRATLAAFSDQRRVVAGLRHLPPPRDLGARVRTGIERGDFRLVPWWRRPAPLFAAVGGGLAVAAGALLAIIVFSGPTDDPQVGDASPTPTTVAETQTPAPTLPPPPEITPTPAAPSPVQTPEPTPTPEPASPEPDLFLAFTGPYDNLALTVRSGATGQTIAEPDTPSGPPIAAELSPDGQWLAYITRLGESGLNEVRATRVADRSDGDGPSVESPVAVGETIVLGESVAGSPFLERLFWSPTGSTLTFTLADPDGGGTDVWMLDVSVGEPRQLTAVGSAYAAAWVPGDADTWNLWVSVAGSEPTSYLLTFDESIRDADFDPIDPAEGPVTATAGQVFQPLLSPNGTLAIFWRGGMERVGDEWLFVEGGAPYLSEHDTTDGTLRSDRGLFGDLTIGRDAFRSAAISWGEDGDAYALWDAQWTGISQGSGGQYPDARRVYFGRATDPRGLTQAHAIDESDLHPEASVVDVKVSPTGRHLVITALRPTGGIMDEPRADLLLVERNTGDVPDEVTVLGSSDRGWFGPAAFGRIER
jgi:hypothetical protein